MLSNEYELYMRDVIGLTRSLNVKSLQTINTINIFLQNYNVTSYDYLPELQKYYRNIAGEYYFAVPGDNAQLISPVMNSDFNDLLDPYQWLRNGAYPHSYEYLKGEIENFIAMKVDTGEIVEEASDQLMWITSLDNKEPILFHPAVLALHPLTRGEYRLEDRWYTDLVDRYPNQEELIRSMLWPVDMNEAIAAPDYTILRWNPALVASNEISLINDLQIWINNYVSRWDNPSFGLTDTLYPAAALAVMFLQIPNEIINLRLAKCKTPEAHGFHIWNYLAGYSRLDRFKDKIFHGQALFLYRNIDHIMMNAGRTATLDFLNEGFAKPYGLELSVYDMRQDSSDLLTDYINRVRVSKTLYGEANLDEDDTLVITPRDVLHRLAEYGLLNPENIDEDEIALEQAVLNSPEGTITTGVIEVNIADQGERGIIDTLSEKMNQWFYLAGSGLFPHKFKLNIPGGEPVIISAAEAAVVLMYAAHRFQNIDGPPPIDIPIPHVREILHDPEETDDQIMAVVEEAYVDQNMIDWLRASVPPEVTVNNIAEFVGHVQAVVKQRVLHEFWWSRERTPNGQGELRAMLGIFYKDTAVPQTIFTTYEDFFKDVQFDISNLSQASYATMATAITTHFVGLTQTKEGMTSPYYEMMEILRILSSYTVAFVAGDGNANIVPMDFPFSLPYGEGRLGELTDEELLEFGLDGCYEITNLTAADEDELSPGSEFILGTETVDEVDIDSPYDLVMGTEMADVGVIESTSTTPYLGDVTVTQVWSPVALFDDNEHGALYDSKLSRHYNVIGGPPAFEGQNVGYVTDLSGNGVDFFQHTSGYRPLWTKDLGLHGWNRELLGGALGDVFEATNDFSVWVVGEAINPTGPYSEIVDFIGGSLEINFGPESGGVSPITFTSSDEAHHIGINLDTTEMVGSQLPGWSVAKYRRVQGSDYDVRTDFNRPYRELAAVDTDVINQRLLIGYSVDPANNELRIIIPAKGINVVRSLNNSNVATIKALNILRQQTDWGTTRTRNRYARVQQAGCINRVLTNAEWISLQNHAASEHTALGGQIVTLP